MKVLLTGGSGYIASHLAVVLLQAGHEVVAVDDLSNSSRESLRRVEKIAGKKLDFIQLDVADKAALSEVFEKHQPDTVVHFAGLKAVGESVAKPLLYYRNNLVSTLSLLETMQDHGTKQLIFSSSATVYGDPQYLPIDEKHPHAPTNPYGYTKDWIEQIIRDWSQTVPDVSIALLRYFNPIGAHESGQIGEDPNGLPNNLLPFVSQVAVGKRDTLQIFGDDYDTPDGTGVRDYIHVTDLAEGHMAALQYAPAGCTAYNLGTGQGVSVLQLVKAFEQASGKTVPYQVVDRRPGDVATVYADATKAQAELHWQATRDIATSCADAWKWQSQNPDGYQA